MLKIQIIETIIAIAAFIVLKIFITGYFERVVAKNIASKNRIKVVKKALNIILVSILLIILFSIFGVDQSELAMFLGSVLTVIGIALFAQWSFLSNITSGVIIFFNHTAKLEDVVTIIDKDYEIEGRISDIGLFFMILKTKDHEQIVIPNSVFLTKMVKKSTPV